MSPRSSSPPANANRSFHGPDPLNLRPLLLTWYLKNHRQLPWRGVDSGYKVLVSEFMLQQTQVATVLPHYERFLTRFPNMVSLAQATEEEVETAWSGLGYYRRARALRNAAQQIVSDHEAEVPTDFEDLKALPGVGDYTAAALGSIIHDEPYAAVDGNVMRVLTRLFGIEDSISNTGTQRELRTLAQELLEPEQAGDWNQAMMELGATVCAPKKPLCSVCPWEEHCVAHAKGIALDLPKKAKPKATVEVHRIAGVLLEEGRCLLTRRTEKLLYGTWELPGLDLDSPEGARERLREHLEHKLGVEVTVGNPLARVRHSITHHRIQVHGYAIKANPKPRNKKNERIWASPGDVANLHTSSMTIKLLNAIAKLKG